MHITGDKSRSKKGSNRSEDSLSPLAAVGTTATNATTGATAGGGAGIGGGTIARADDDASTNAHIFDKEHQHRKDQLSRNTQHNASLNSMRKKNKGYVGLHGSREGEGVVGDMEAGGVGGGHSTNHSNASRQASTSLHRSSRRNL